LRFTKRTPQMGLLATVCLTLVVLDWEPTETIPVLRAATANAEHALIRQIWVALGGQVRIRIAERTACSQAHETTKGPNKSVKSVKGYRQFNRTDAPKQLTVC